MPLCKSGGGLLLLLLLLLMLLLQLLLPMLSELLSELLFLQLSQREGIQHRIPSRENVSIAEKRTMMGIRLLMLATGECQIVPVAVTDQVGRRYRGLQHHGRR